MNIFVTADKDNLNILIVIMLYLSIFTLRSLIEDSMLDLCLLLGVLHKWLHFE